MYWRTAANTFDEIDAKCTTSSFDGTIFWVANIQHSQRMCSAAQGTEVP